MGLEPTIFGLGGQRVIHCATAAHRPTKTHDFLLLVGPKRRTIHPRVFVVAGDSTLGAWKLLPIAAAGDARAHSSSTE